MTQLNAQDNTMRPASHWMFRLGYFSVVEKPELEVTETSAITVPGGASYLSTSAGALKLENKGQGISLNIEFPRTDFFVMDIDLGSLGYGLAIPSGPVTNYLARSEGFLAGIGLTAELVRQTMVTPRVTLRLSWQKMQVSPERILLSGDGRWQSVDDRWQMTTTVLAVNVQDSWWSNRLEPSAGFEIFSRTSRLTDRRQEQEVSGQQQGYRIRSKLAVKLSSREAIVTEAFIGNDLGYQLMIEQRF